MICSARSSASSMTSSSAGHHRHAVRLRGRLETRADGGVGQYHRGEHARCRAHGCAASRDSAPRRVSGCPSHRPRAAVWRQRAAASAPPVEITPSTFLRNGNHGTGSLSIWLSMPPVNMYSIRLRVRTSSTSAHVDRVAVELDRILADRHAAEIVELSDQPAQLARRQRVIGDHVADAKRPPARGGAGIGPVAFEQRPQP